MAQVNHTRPKFEITLDDKLAAQVVRGLSDLRLAEDHLSQPGAVAQVDKDHTTVVTTTGHPAGESDSLAFEFFIQVPRKVSAQHGFHVLPRDGESNLAKFTRLCDTTRPAPSCRRPDASAK